MDLQKLQKLNEQIKAYNGQVSRAEIERRMLVDKLKEDCAKIKETLGVDIWSDNLADVYKEAKKLYAEQEKKLEEEVAFKESVIKAYNEGDFKKVAELTGVKDVSVSLEDLEEVEVSEDIEGVTFDEVDNTEEEFDLSLEVGTDEPVIESTPTVEQTDFGSDFDFDFGEPLQTPDKFQSIEEAADELVENDINETHGIKPTVDLFDGIPDLNLDDIKF